MRNSIGETVGQAIYEGPFTKILLKTGPTGTKFGTLDDIKYLASL
jgi:hypothetical protein